MKLCVKPPNAPEKFLHYICTRAVFRKWPCSLPFSTIYVLCYYILSIVWGHKFYKMYGILLIIFIILLVITFRFCFWRSSMVVEVILIVLSIFHVCVCIYFLQIDIGYLLVYCNFGLSFMVNQMEFWCIDTASATATATAMIVQTWMVFCKHFPSLDIWLANFMLCYIFCMLGTVVFYSIINIYLL